MGVDIDKWVEITKVCYFSLLVLYAFSWSAIGKVFKVYSTYGLIDLHNVDNKP